ncbi:collagen alpha-1(IX) chain-like [Erinaceus europaeus]|uniref:Collagen alpha-1(IX) chain-like n=1 Tax=Erinaceus europaeus TaxID=9365 RepID=A0ABM3WTI4_ERIEU|nr:collagen alpha-1(IX) chain-like [Erinaceus europaeus]
MRARKDPGSSPSPHLQGEASRAMKPGCRCLCLSLSVSLIRKYTLKTYTEDDHITTERFKVGKFPEKRRQLSPPGRRPGGGWPWVLSLSVTDSTRASTCVPEGFESLPPDEPLGMWPCVGWQADGESGGRGGHPQLPNGRQRGPGGQCQILTLSTRRPASGAGHNGQTPKAGQEGSPQTPGQEGSPQTPGQEGSPQLPGQEGSPQTPGQEGSPQTPGQEGSPQTPGQEGSPQLPGQEGSPQLPGQEGSPQLPAQEGSPQTPGQEGSPQLPAQEGSPQTPGQEGSPRLPGQEGSPRLPGIRSVSGPLLCSPHLTSDGPALRRGVLCRGLWPAGECSPAQALPVGGKGTLGDRICAVCVATGSRQQGDLRQKQVNLRRPVRAHCSLSCRAHRLPLKHLTDRTR